MITFEQCQGTFSKLAYAFWEAVDAAPFESAPEPLKNLGDAAIVGIPASAPPQKLESFKYTIEHCIRVKTEWTYDVHQGRGPSVYVYFTAARDCTDPDSTDYHELNLPIIEIHQSLGVP